MAIYISCRLCWQEARSAEEPPPMDRSVAMETRTTLDGKSIRDSLIPSSTEVKQIGLLWKSRTVRAAKVVL